MSQPNRNQAARFERSAGSSRETFANSGVRRVQPPSISLPAGGGAIRGMGESFSTRTVMGAASMSVPVAMSPGRAGFAPHLALSYDSASGNGPFGFGWSLAVPSVSRKTDKGLPRYADAQESDVFVLSGMDDLVPQLDDKQVRAVDDASVPGFVIERFRPRIEETFIRVERWTRSADGDVHWRTLTPDNLLSVYGLDEASRIADPANSRNVFSWLLCQTRDDRGQAIAYEYKQEDGKGLDTTSAHEQHRGAATSAARIANRYIKFVRYGNRVPQLDAAGQRPVHVTTPALQNADWMFEVVFDYGEHDPDAPKPSDAGAWLLRNDPFSSYRPGFELRTYRLCQRVLMFHHFPDRPGVLANCLVRSTDFVYRETRGVVEDRHRGNPRGTFLASVSQSGYRRADVGYTSKSVPPLAFEYSQSQISSEVRELDAASTANLPAGVDGSAVRWVDLDGEGLAGALTAQSDAWYYKRNLGDGKLGPLEPVAPLPARGSGPRQLLDVDGDGRLDLVQLDALAPGFYARSAPQGWDDFVTFESVPNIEWQAANTRLVDLTGDGLADLLVTEDDVFTWYPSLAAAGFGPSRKVRIPPSEERGPRVVFRDDSAAILLADMTGDGLTDLVRIRNGSACYWPNLGYGRFGAKVTFSSAPWFDTPDQFDPKRIRLTDVDGSGLADLIYIGRNDIRVWLNEAGNAWAQPATLPQIPHLDRSTSVDVADLLGNGTACLVWSSPLATDGRAPLRFIDLMGGVKPNLLIRCVNHLGAETRIRYAPSTKFYLADRFAGKPWVTRLPFPVQVVERVEHLDHVSRTRAVSLYAYHHGYFDGVEQEFRGFAMVEQQDTEAFEDYIVGVKHFDGTQELAPELFQPAVTRRTWFHTGAYGGGPLILHQMRDEYYLKTQHTPEPVLPADMDSQEYRECLRALKGMPLREETYSFDGSDRQRHPYRVIEYNYEVNQVQKRSAQHSAAFFSFGVETLTLDYERNPADPRIGHAVNIEMGPFGNVTRSASIVYGRQVSDGSLPPTVSAEQAKPYVTYAELDYTPDFDRLAPVPAYRLRTPFETRGYEITGLAPAAALFTAAELRAQIPTATALDYEAVAQVGKLQRRLLARGCTVFRNDALAALPLGQWDTLGIEYERYQLALTESVVNAYYGGQLSSAEIAAAGYVHFDGTADWWIPSGIDLYPNDPEAHFFVPRGVRDALGLETEVTLDADDLLTERVRVVQAAWSESQVTNDYRVLGAVEQIDPNKNRTAFELDELSLVVKSALLGKAGAGEGDTLADPTVKYEYDFFNWVDNGKPAFSRMLSREQHGGANTRWQESYLYSNGGGDIVMTKTLVHPGKALRRQADGTITEVDADPRWAASGRTIVNNKGSAVKQYEPYFSDSREYESEEALQKIGVTPLRYYDALGRLIRTASPDGTDSRVEFDSWTQRLFDASDTVLESVWFAARGAPDPALEPEPLNDRPRRSAWLAAKHANTPATLHFDSLGRITYAVGDHGAGVRPTTRVRADLTGRFTAVFDARDREVSSGFSGLSGPILANTAEKGSRWVFNNVLGAVVAIWDEHGRDVRIDYDELHRPVSQRLRELDKPEIVYQHMVYGDRHPNGEALRILGALHLLFDQAGEVRIPEADFKANPKRAERFLAGAFEQALDWSAVAARQSVVDKQTAADAQLDTTEVFTTSALYDAAGRPTSVTLPDRTQIVPTYNRGGILSRLQARLGGVGPLRDFLKNQEYDAKGLRQFAQYGNGVLIRYLRDPQTFRLTQLVVSPQGADPATQALLNVEYEYDPVGNITWLRDKAQATRYFNNSAVVAESRYEYDAGYQLVRATGRELSGSNNSLRTHEDLATIMQLPHPGNTEAVRTYTQEFDYDILGNLKVLRHRYKPTPGAGAGWTRFFRYAYEDNAADRTNRLSSTSLPGDPDAGPYTGTFGYDDYGNMARMPHLPSLAWNGGDQLAQADLGGGGTAYYVYGAQGQRVRKVIVRGTLLLEWLFLGAVTIYRRRRRGVPGVELERVTVHISDNTGLIARADTKTRDPGNSEPASALNTPIIRYQHGNHLGSCVVETNEAGDVVSAEEFHPYGTSAFRISKPGENVSLKRFRFAGQERDDETGLDCMGRRYYAPWLARWTSSDPAGFIDGANLFRYARNNPVRLTDSSGTRPDEQSVHVSIEQEDFTGKENWNVAQFRDAMRRAGAELPSWVKDSNARIYFSPNIRQDLESHSWERLPGGAWVLDARRSTPKKSPPRAPPPPPMQAPPVEAPPPAPVEMQPPDSTAPSKTDPLPGTVGTVGGQAAPAAEKYIWNRKFPGEGLPGTQRGRILEWLLGNSWRDNKKGYDFERPGTVDQVKSTQSYKKVGGTVRGATRDAAGAIGEHPHMAGKQPRAVIITPTDAPKGVGQDIADALGKAKKPIPNAASPEHIRGLPGKVGLAGKIGVGVGFAFSAWGLWNDYQRGDVPMGIGDFLGVVGGGLEIAAIAVPGGLAIGGVTAMTAGLVIGGIGLAVVSGVGMYRAAEVGDTAGVVAGGVGVAAGLAIAGGAILIAASVAAGPVILAVGIVAAIGVGVFHAGRYFGWWD